MLESILLPVIIVAGIGVGAGVMLALASKFMSIPPDERLEAVRGLLPGINCGACGYAGCDQYAGAIVHDGAPTNKCIPGGDGTSASLSEVLGTTALDVREMVSFVACKGVGGDNKRKMNYEGISTCAAATQLYGGDLACSFGCLAYGDCAAACPYHAISVDGGVAVVHPELCTGCGLCVRTCPKKLLTLYPLDLPVHVRCSSHEKGANTRKVCTNGCIACQKCVKTCPSEAITMQNNLAFIDVDKCTNCGACIQACPVHVIERFHPSCEVI